MSESLSSEQLKEVLERVKADKLTSSDRECLIDLLEPAIKLRQLVEAAQTTSGNKKVIASLPFGLDIVK